MNGYELEIWRGQDRRPKTAQRRDPKLTRMLIALQQSDEDFYADFRDDLDATANPFMEEIPQHGVLDAPVGTQNHEVDSGLVGEDLGHIHENAEESSDGLTSEDLLVRMGAFEIEPSDPASRVEMGWLPANESSEDWQWDQNSAMQEVGFNVFNVSGLDAQISVLDFRDVSVNYSVAVQISRYLVRNLSHSGYLERSRSRLFGRSVALTYLHSDYLYEAGINSNRESRGKEFKAAIASSPIGPEFEVIASMLEHHTDLQRGETSPTDIMLSLVAGLWLQESMLVSLDQLESIRVYLARHLDPCGVCALGPLEAARIRLRSQRGELFDESDDVVLAAEQLLDRPETLMPTNLTGVCFDPKVYRSARRLIQHLAFSLTDSHEHSMVRIADFEVSLNDDGELVIARAPKRRIQIRTEYRRLFDALGDRRTRASQDEIRSARLTDRQAEQCKEWRTEAEQWINNENVRIDLANEVMLAILSIQRPFFEHGFRRLRPMRLRDVAEAVTRQTNRPIGESSIHYTVQDRYVDTQFGVYPLRELFSNTSTHNAGEAVSKRRVQSLLREIVEEESPDDPLSDARIASLLCSKHDIAISRRTVAKYRGNLKIPVKHIRSRLAAFESSAMERKEGIV